MPRKYVKSHADFFKVLDESMALTKRYMAARPRFEPLEEVEVQLDQMMRWTANGRNPTREEIESMHVGAIAFRHLRSKDNYEAAEYAVRLIELGGYFDKWPKK